MSREKLKNALGLTRLDERGIKSTGGGRCTMGVVGGEGGGGNAGVTWGGGGGGQTFRMKNRPSHHEIVFPEQFWGIAFLEKSKGIV